MERSLSSPWRRPYASEQGKRTRTPSETSEPPKSLINNFLDAREVLAEEHLAKASGLQITRKYADLMDRFIRSLFLEAGFRRQIKTVPKDSIAVVALGSYGRRELCLGSDIDLMVIHQGRLSPEMEQVVKQSIYPLWDAKLEVGHSILTLSECIQLAIHDFRVLTSVLEARLLFGSTACYRLFQTALWSRIHREKEPLLKQFLTHQEKREERYGSEGYFVEPDIKEGLGGLRDLHFMRWMARIYFNCDRLSQIKRFAAFSHFGLNKLSLSRGFILRVRNHLHYALGRKEDRLLLSFQNDLSRILGYEDDAQNTGPERFMRHLYLHLNRIRYGREEFQVKALDIIHPSPWEMTPRPLSPHLEMVGGNIVLRRGSSMGKDALLILKALGEANRRGLSLGSGFIWEAMKKIAREGKKLVGSGEAKELFLELIVDPVNSKIIRLALEIGLVDLFIPEFKRIRNLPQFGFYHVETVDLHSLRTLEVLYGISEGSYDPRWPLLREVFGELRHPDHLFLAGLLHDIGKGYKGDHSQKGAQMIPRILKRLAISGKAIEVVPFLVRHHLLLARTSQRRDLGEERTSVQVAQTLQDKGILQMLFLLTVADSVSTGPMARSDWKIMLLTELFFKVSRILERGVLATPDAFRKITDQKRTVLVRLVPEFPEKDVVNIMDQAPSQYFLSTPADIAAHHFRLALGLGEDRFSWVLQKLKTAGVTRVIQCIRDRPGLFSKMVGVFTLNNIKVLSVNVFTLKNGLAFDVYEVTNPLDPYREIERWKKIHEEIGVALEDRLPLDERIQEKVRTELPDKGRWKVPDKKVMVNNEASDFFTVIEVSSGEQPGLLYHLAKKLFSLGLDIRFARVHTDKERMTGVFYVSDPGGQKVQAEEQIRGIKEGILSLMS